MVFWSPDFPMLVILLVHINMSVKLQGHAFLGIKECMRVCIGG